MELVAEFTINHLGNAVLLNRMVEAATAAGADSIKMQRKRVSTFYSPGKRAERRDSPFGKTFGEYRSGFELEESAWDDFASRCSIPWFFTAHDFESLRAMERFSPKRVKLASVNARNIPLLNQVSVFLGNDVEIVLSLGGCSLAEADRALSVFAGRKRIYLLHCVAEYPTEPDNLRLGNIPILISSFGSETVTIGYSGHEVGIDASLAAHSLGAEMIERHFCISRASFAHHIECSLEPGELSDLKHKLSSGVTAHSLPDRAYESSFGMTASEARFLMAKEYP
jgi:sialic acid synthase SpsE